MTSMKSSAPAAAIAVITWRQRERGVDAH